jgi:hypothetical protein
MTVTVHELWLYASGSMDGAAAMRWLHTRLVDSDLPAPEPKLVPLPYARTPWAAGESGLLAGAPVLSTPKAVARAKNAAWPVGLTHLDASAGAILLVSVPLQLPGRASSSYPWLCRVAEQMLHDDSEFDVALINGSGDSDDEAPGEGGLSRSHLAQPLPSVVAPWLYLSDRWRALPELTSRFGDLPVTTRTLRHGAAFTLSADFRTPIAEATKAAVEAVASRPVQVLQGGLSD